MTMLLLFRKTSTSLTSSNEPRSDQLVHVISMSWFSVASMGMREGTSVWLLAEQVILFHVHFESWKQEQLSGHCTRRSRNRSSLVGSELSIRRATPSLESKQEALWKMSILPSCDRQLLVSNRPIDLGSLPVSSSMRENNHKSKGYQQARASACKRRRSWAELG